MTRKDICKRIWETEIWSEFTPLTTRILRAVGKVYVSWRTWKPTI